MQKLKNFQEQKEIIPKILVIDICAACNADCLFCARQYMPQERASGYMNYELFKSILEEASLLGIKILRLYSTAEPTLHPEFEKFIDLAHSLNFYINLSTNASKLLENKHALVKIDNLQYSIEGWDETSYEKYRYPLKFNKIFTNIQNFKNFVSEQEKKPNITINLLITKKTNIESFVNLWSDYCDKIVINSMLPSNMFENGKFIFTNNPKIENDYLEFTKIKSDYYCEYLFEVMYISYDGKISLCCRDFYSALDLGNISDGIVNRYNSKELNMVREEFYQQKLSICQECSVFFKPTDKDKIQWKTQISTLPTPIKNKIFITGK